MIRVMIMARRPEYKGEWRRRNTIGVFHPSSHTAINAARREAYVRLAGWEAADPYTEFEVVVS